MGLAAVFAPKVIEFGLGSVATLLKNAGADKTIHVSDSTFTDFFIANEHQALQVNPGIGCLLAVYGTFDGAVDADQQADDHAVAVLRDHGYMTEKSIVEIIFEAEVRPSSDRTASSSTVAISASVGCLGRKTGRTRVRRYVDGDERLGQRRRRHDRRRQHRSRNVGTRRRPCAETPAGRRASTIPFESHAVGTDSRRVQGCVQHGCSGWGSCREAVHAGDVRVDDHASREGVSVSGHAWRIAQRRQTGRGQCDQQARLAGRTCES